ncbi:hypothetical protein REPUB_Repub11eG0154800 [Reevesia pubescens]
MDDEPEVIYVLRIFHGGRFVNGNELIYVDGDVVEYEVDPNNVSYSRMLKVIRELGYRLEPYIYFKVPGELLGDGLVLLHNNLTATQLTGHLLHSFTVELYVDHTANVPDVQEEQHLFLPPNDSGVLVDEAIRDNGLDEGMNEANRDDGLDEGLNVACEVDEYESFLIDVAYLSDNDDEEIQAIREKVKNFKVMNGKQKNEVKNIEIPVHIVDEGIDEVLGEGESDTINECEVAEDNTLRVSLDEKVQGYESDYMDSDDPGEYESEQSDDEQRRKGFQNQDQGSSSNQPQSCKGKEKIQAEALLKNNQTREKNGGFQGIGIYTNLNTGAQVWNPGRPSQRTLSTKRKIGAVDSSQFNHVWKRPGLKRRGKQATTSTKLQEQKEAMVSNKRKKSKSDPIPGAQGCQAGPPNI